MLYGGKDLLPQQDLKLETEGLQVLALKYDLEEESSTYKVLYPQSYTWDSGHMGRLLKGEASPHST